MTHRVLIVGGGFGDDGLIAAARAGGGFGDDGLIAAARAGGGLKTLADARDLRSSVLCAFELAELATDPHERAAWLRFAIVGAGPTGIELAGQVAALAQRVLPRDYPAIDTRQARISLLEAGPRVLPELPEPLRVRAARELAELGVDVWLRARVVGADDEGVELAAGLRVPARTVLWAAGAQAPPFAQHPSHGSLKDRAYNRARHHLSRRTSSP